MKRPLVWVGVAYILGEVWAALGGFLSGGFLFGTLGLCVMIRLKMTGQERYPIFKDWLLYFLPVIFFAGIVCFCRDSTYPYVMESKETKTVCFSGTVAEWEEKENYIAVKIFEARVWENETNADTADENTVKAGLCIYLDKADGENVTVGDVLTGTGEIQMPETATNAGQFDMAAYYLARDIHYICWAESFCVVAHHFTYRQVLLYFKACWLAVYDTCLNEKTSGILKAILLGDQSTLDADTKSLYQEAGIIHVLAISGLHIAIIGMGVFHVFKYIGFGLKGSACVSAFLVLSYGAMVGFSPSTLRAVIMFLMRMGAVYLGESYDRLTALSVSALVILVRQPLMLTQSGVQFSFAAALALQLLWRSAKKLCEPYNQKDADMKHRFLRKIADIAGPSAAVTLVTLPLSAFYYGKISLVSFFLNLVVLPMMGVLVPVGLMAGLVGFFSLSLAKFLMAGLQVLLNLCEWICRCACALPFSSIYIGVPPVWVLVVYGWTLVLFIIILKLTDYQRKRAMLVLMLCGIIFIPFRRMSAMVAFLDVGQGDCIFIRTPAGSTWLIDGGSSDVSEVGNYRIAPFLTYYGEKTVDYVCVSHGDSDHISGISELLEMGMVKHLILTKKAIDDENCQELSELAFSYGTEVLYIEEGDCWSDGGWIFECLHPTANESVSDSNDSSMVLKISAGETTFLLTGDISQKVEESLSREDLADVDVIKVAHHGSAYSSSAEFLEKMQAEIAIISCGKNNRYGHPSEAALTRIEAAGITYYCTMDGGAVLMFYRNRKFYLTQWGLR